MGRSKTQRIHFIRGSLAGLAAPKAGRRYIYDDTVPSLAVCVTNTGTRTFFVIRKIHGKPERIRLGLVAELGVERARNIAREIIGKVAAGENVAEQRRVRQKAPTLDDAFAAWLERHARIHRKDADRLKQVYERRISPALGRRKLVDIRPADASAFHTEYGITRGKVEANRLNGILKTVVTWAEEGLGYKGKNPFAGVKLFDEVPRERYATEEELQRIRAALKKAPQDIADIIRLLLLTASRKTSLLSMQWQDVNFANATWTIPSTAAKARRSITVPLVPEAVEILRRRREAVSGPWVFPAKQGAGYLSYIYRDWLELLAAAGVSGLTLHDLRRTAATWMIATGASLPTISALLGHRSQTATRIYAKLDLAPVRSAIEKAAAKMLGEGGVDGS